MSLRDRIESMVLTYGYHAGEQGAYKICTDEILKELEKRIESRLIELKSGMNDRKLKNMLPEEKWKQYYEKLEQSFDELEILKKELLK